MRTAGIKDLMREVLEALPKPHSEDAIEDVFASIENNPIWRARYDILVTQLGKSATNSWGGFWIAHLVGRHGVDQTKTNRTTLIQSYSKLTRAGHKPTRKRLKEPEAAKIMSDYYYANKSSLPEAISQRRELVIDLLMEGFEVAEAFRVAQQDPALAS